MTTKKERQEQIKYMLENKAEYLKNGTSEQDFNERLDKLRNPKKYLKRITLQDKTEQCFDCGEKNAEKQSEGDYKCYSCGIYSKDNKKTY